MTDWRETIGAAVMEIASRSSQVTEIQPEQLLTRDLGFSSLDYAELVATLEATLSVDPFSQDVAITSIRSVNDLYQAYQKYCT